jgi:glycosyltransferase involved in cell wall biosynthesis
MRVLIINAYGRVTGGADKHCFDLAHLLRADGHDVAFLTTADGGNEVSNGAFIPRHVSNATRESLSRAEQSNVARRAIWNSTAAGAMQRLAAEWHPHVVHVHNIYPQLSVSPVVEAARLKVPIVQTAHDYQFISATYTDPRGGSLDTAEARIPIRALNSALYAIKRRLHVPVVDEWITVSRAAAGHYAAGGVDARVLPNFVPLGAAPRGVVGLSARNGVVYAGRLVVEKGVADVVALAGRLAVPVRIIGSGPLAGFVKHAAAHIPNLTFLGARSHAEVQEHVARARVVVMPSRWQEPGPLAALEAMAAGTPVVTYSSGGLSEYIDDGAAGSTVRSDVDDLRRGVNRYLDNDDEWRRTSAAARNAATGVHASGNYVKHVVAAYDDAIRKRAAR